MKFSTDRRLQAGFWLLTLVPVLFGLLAAHSVNETIRAAQELKQSNELIRELESFLSRLKDVEVDQREFVLTNDESYATDIRKAKADVDRMLGHIQSQNIGDNWKELLRTLLPEKFSQIDTTLKLRREGDLQGATATLKRSENGQAMDDIRRSVNAMIGEQSKLLDEHQDNRNRQFIYMLVVFVVVLLVNAALIWTLFYSVRLESARMERVNEELEERVEQRTVELRRSNDELQQFAYVASHDLKEPMRMISSYATLLQRRYEGRLDEDADTFIHFITDGVRRMNTLITDLLSYSRAGQLGDDPKVRVETEQVLASVLENIKASVVDTGAVVTYDALPAITYEPVRLSQLLQNLLSNALKYRRPDVPPFVHISADQVGNEIQFSVRDNGQGIAPEYQADIFGIFKRLHGKDVEGTGIGLATCKKIVEEHGGRIWVESQPGAGSIFHFTVPVVKSTVQHRAATM